MNCEQVRERISPYLDGEVDRDQRLLVEQHLDSCPDCSLYFEELKRLGQDLEVVSDDSVEVSPDFTRELFSRARREFRLNYVRELRDSSPENFVAEYGTKMAAPLMLVCGLLIGGYLGLGFQEVAEQNRPRVQNRTPAVREQPESPQITPASAEVVSYTDAYFELADSRTDPDN